MNQVFCIEELVRQIASNADDGPLGSASLLAFACWCKILEDPVMDILWQRQKYLHIILRALPADCWTITNQVYRLSRTPATNEWERFRRYTARVVELFVGKVHSGEVSSETISFLAMRSTLDPLWPRLTSLRLTKGLGWDAVPSTLAFLSPKTTNFTLVLPRDSNILLQPILLIASDRCHRLQELVLDVIVGDSCSAHGVGGLISACRDTLRTLEIRSPFTAEHLLIVANLPQLRNLRLEVARFPCDLPLDAFPSLEEVTILRFHGPRLQHFFKCLRTTSLKVVKIYGFGAIGFKKSIAAISRFSASLRVLEISAVANLELPSAVVPRLLFANLTNLHVGCLRWGDGVYGPCMFRPTDEDIAELGVAIPNITHLTLGSPTCPDLRCVTFLSLVSLSKTCQDLETLVIRVDFQTMIAPSFCNNEDAEADATFDGTQGNACKLRKLVVGSSTLPIHPESGWLVAIGLGKIFPFLSEVAGYGLSLDRYKWGQVGRNIGMSRQVLRSVQR
ncbi:hypothetical protein BDM02DRAFT_1934317 [Thelephora ganbajun]|uniref:Uncharacterized protein n=1 Tax=Thelephora ganbajun TaxID=370292 RepID=A0ACB6ZIS1_THEGA|nr:hypothetical protein BDM02DRAFT_1934317 [Thelephora ganbajun]